MKRLIFIIALGLASCQPCPAQEFPEYWKLPFGYIGSYGSVNFPQGRMWFAKDTLNFAPLIYIWEYAGDTTEIMPTLSNTALSTLWEYAGDVTEITPMITGGTDAIWENDINGDLQPK